MVSEIYTNLASRCNILINKFLQTQIDEEDLALREERALPFPDFDKFAAFRLLSHAELEDYYESKARLCLNALDSKFQDNQDNTFAFAALKYLYLWKNRKSLEIPDLTADFGSTSNRSYSKTLAQDALGFGRQFIEKNNGIKEESMLVLSALIGLFPDEICPELILELNQYGRRRGGVAHKSWTNNTRTFFSAMIERDKLIKILKLTRDCYEN